MKVKEKGNAKVKKEKEKEKEKGNEKQNEKEDTLLASEQMEREKEKVMMNYLVGIQIPEARAHQYAKALVANGIDSEQVWKVGGAEIERRIDSLFWKGIVGVIR